MKLTLRIRTYADTPTVALVWLVQSDGPAQSCLLHGHGMMPSVAEKLAEWFEGQGVKVERETRDREQS